ncbi:LysR family transcriptional regulator [Paraburkholderia graminis]|uniref:LysR family transcriptional regulator n=1 Tax=Paraburkholderia graminis TaxID=60548 RepID=UPI0038BAD318
MRLLQVFDEIHRNRSVSKAADELEMSQPSISVALAKLRDHFDDPLFVRTSEGMQATPLAQQLITSIRGALQLLDQLLSTKVGFDPAAATRTFTICMTDITQMVVLPRILEKLKDRARHVSINVVRLTDETYRNMESGSVDLTIGYLSDPKAGIYQHRLLERDFVCVASANHPRIMSQVSTSLFENEGHLIVGANGSGLALAEDWFHKNKIRRNIILRVPDLLGVDKIISESELIATVPRPVGDFLAKSGLIKVYQHPIELPTYLVKQHWHERFHLDPGNQWLRRVISDIMNPEVKLI